MQTVNVFENMSGITGPHTFQITQPLIVSLFGFGSNSRPFFQTRVCQFSLPEPASVYSQIMQRGETNPANEFFKNIFRFLRIFYFLPILFTGACL